MNRVLGANVLNVTELTLSLQLASVNTRRKWIACRNDSTFVTRLWHSPINAWPAYHSARCRSVLCYWTYSVAWLHAPRLTWTMVKTISIKAIWIIILCIHNSQSTIIDIIAASVMAQSQFTNFTWKLKAKGKKKADQLENGHLAEALSRTNS